MRRKQARDHARATLVAAVAFAALLGIVIGAVLACQEANWFSPRVNLGQVLQAGMLLVVFFLANHYYVKVHDVRKKLVEIRIDIADDVAETAREVHSTYSRCEDAKEISRSRQAEIYRCLRSYSNAVYTLGRTLRESEVPTFADFEVLREDREKFRDILTSDPYPDRVSIEQLRRESKMYDKIRSNIRMFQLKLARSR